MATSFVEEGVGKIKEQVAFKRGANKLGIEGSDPVPQTDAFIKQAQEAWYPDAPTEHLINHSVENAPQIRIDQMNKIGAAALTVPDYIKKGGILTGKSSIYYNPNGAAFTSAKQLFYTMGHEMVHVSQIATLSLQGITTVKAYNSAMRGGMRDVFEFHAYSYETSLGSSNYGGYRYPGAAAEIMKRKPNLFKSLNYTNFQWTRNTKFKYPF